MFTGIIEAFGSVESIVKDQGNLNITIKSPISSELKVNMKSISINSNGGVFEGKIQLYVNNTIHLLRLIKKLQKVRNVIKVSRFEE